MREEIGYRLRLIKLCAGTASIEGDNDFDFTVPQIQYGGNDAKSVMEGAQYEVKNSNLDDEIKFQVVHPTYGVVDEFAHIAAIDGNHLFSQYIADMPVGLTIRLKYIRVGPNVAEIKCNLLRHIYTRI